MWIKGTPKDRGIYNILAESGETKKFKSFGYWNGEYWEMVSEASDYQSFEPAFEDYGMSVTHYLDEASLPQPPEE